MGTGSDRQTTRARDAVIVDVARTPVGKRNGMLAAWHPVDLAAEVIGDLVARNDFDPALVDDVILGCVSQTGEQGLNTARNAVLAAGLPETVPGTTVDRQCGSSQQAIHFAAQGVMAGAYDLVIAGGVESMSRVPMGSSILNGPGLPFGPLVKARYEMAGGLVPQGIAAERVAEKWGLERDELDAYSLESHRRAAGATDEGRFDREILAVRTTAGAKGTGGGRERRPVAPDTETGGARSAAPARRGSRSGPRTAAEPGRATAADEGIRRDTSIEALGALKPAFVVDGRITAGNSSQISDGAAAVLVTSEERAAELGLKPRARFVSFALAGVDPISMLTATVAATDSALTRAGLTVDDIDRFEVNEAFASVVLAWAREIGPDMTRVNVNGGAIALGHPLGASGARLAATLVCELERSGSRYGLQVMCEGGGMANAMVLERIA